MYVHVEACCFLYSPIADGQLVFWGRSAVCHLFRLPTMALRCQRSLPHFCSCIWRSL